MGPGKRHISAYFGSYTEKYEYSLLFLCLSLLLATIDVLQERHLRFQPQNSMLMTLFVQNLVNQC